MEPEEPFSVETSTGPLHGFRHPTAGEPALVLHGGPGLSDYTEPLAAELSERFAPVRYQQRGVAPSTMRGPFTVETHVADAVAVLDALEIESGWVVGHSWGGYLAMHVAVAHPERVRGLICIDGLGAVGDGGMAAFGDELSRRYERLRGEPLPEDASLADYWPCYFPSPEQAPPTPPMTASHDVFTATFASITEHVERGTLERALPSVRRPAVFVHGDGDPLPPQASAASAELLEGARLEILEGCGHFPWLDCPGSIVAAIARARP